MLEKEIEQKVCEYAKSKGLWPEKFKTPAKRAAPDRIISGFPGTVFFVEFKATGKAKTIHPGATGHEGRQYRDHLKRRKLGHRVYVCDSVEYGERIINFEITGNAAWLSAESNQIQSAS